jgi:transposase
MQHHAWFYTPSKQQVDVVYEKVDNSVQLTIAEHYVWVVRERRIALKSSDGVETLYSLALLKSIKAIQKFLDN